MRFGYKHFRLIPDLNIKPINQMQRLIHMIKDNIKESIYMSIIDTSELDYQLCDIGLIQQLQSLINEHHYQLYFYLDDFNYYDAINHYMNQIELDDYHLIVPSKYVDHLVSTDKIILINDEQITIQQTIQLAKQMKCPVYLNMNKEIIINQELVKQLIDYNQLMKMNVLIIYTQLNNQEDLIDLKRLIEETQFILPEVDLVMDFKDANLSALKVMNIMDSNRSMKHLEDEWAKYKYLILAHDPSSYQIIRQLLKEKKEYPVLSFYHVIDDALKESPQVGHQVNAIMHIWGYFKNDCDQLCRNQMNELIIEYSNHQSNLKEIKTFLYQLAKQYQSKYLLESYYFLFD